MTGMAKPQRTFLIAAALVLAAMPTRLRAQQFVDFPDAPEPRQSSQAKQPQTLPIPSRCAEPASSKVPPDQSCQAVVEKPPNKLAPFENSTQPNPLTPAQKFHLAVRNVKDPFNLASIGFFSAIDIATDSHGPYGPGMKGFAKDVGTTFTEDMNGQFWGTFAIDSIFHEDPHYHRMPKASIKRRIAHCFDAVIVAQSDYGKPVPNYEQFIASPITASINNLYVPYPRTNVESTVDRVLVEAAFEPAGNAVTEFLPDIAKRVNVRIVIVQKVLNRLYESQSNGASLQ